ncbi:MAG: putative 4-hydroxybenzoate polyprenyltransferase [Proteobacteria bacterium]|nr:putative 4-hydroxybenzoate polyprenyltransferase [Pseudomonadota bacterium]MBU1595892.1 putative 4-hydroxybenzoate polyprenyltransferase [Pseudomonadota bacterium]
MIKIEHSVFALPFAFTGAFLAAKSGPDWTMPSWAVLAPLAVAMVAVRSFAMAYNRLADVDIDSRNPRTKARPLVTGELSVAFTKRFIFVCAIVFTTACALLNSTCLALSPLALAWSAFYSHTKRFTPLCHFVLGSVLGLAPVAGWLAVSPSRLGYPALLLFFAVSLWVAGFDILYACQDEAFDRSQGLHSLPAAQGVPRALFASSWTHAAAALLFPMAGWYAGLGLLYTIVALLVGGILVWEHKLIRPDDLSQVNVAFFTLNGVIAVFVFLGAWADLALGSPWMFAR